MAVIAAMTLAPTAQAQTQEPSSYATPAPAQNAYAAPQQPAQGQSQSSQLHQVNPRYRGPAIH